MSGAAFRACSGLRRSQPAIKTRVKDIHIYGRGLSAVPDEWEPLMSTLENPLERNHKGPVGKI